MNKLILKVYLFISKVKSTSRICTKPIDFTNTSSNYKQHSYSNYLHLVVFILVIIWGYFYIFLLYQEVEKKNK